MPAPLILMPAIGSQMNAACRYICISAREIVSYSNHRKYSQQSLLVVLIKPDHGNDVGFSLRYIM